LLALLVALASLLAEGTLLDLWNLKREKTRLEKRYIEITKSNVDLRGKLDQARHSSPFIARQARDKLDLVKEDELIFIFENDDLHQTPTASR
jgi:cell division protein FtsB